jgi:hypothetical protein
MLDFARKPDAIAISITATVERVSIVAMRRPPILNSIVIFKHLLKKPRMMKTPLL